MRVFTSVDYAKVKPLWDQVVIQLEEPPKKIGAIIIPDAKRDMDTHTMVLGRVIAAGPMAFYYNVSGTPERMAVAEGDLVVFRPYAGDLHESQTKADGPQFRIMESRAIIGVYGKAE